jgi:hypothetical protein
MGAPHTVRVIEGGESVYILEEPSEAAAMSRALEAIADAQAIGYHAIAEVYDRTPRLVFGVTSSGHLYDEQTAARVLGRMA